MNIKIKIRLKNDVLKTADNTKFLTFDKAVYIQNIFMIPWYATLGDVTPKFMEEPGIYEQVLKKYIHEGSMEADTIINSRVVEFFGLSPEITFYIKRRFTICYATYHFAQVFYRDYLKSIKKQKFLADVKVSLEIEKEPDFINKIRADALLCMEEIKNAATALDNMRGFVKGECNPCNAVVGRLWYPSQGENWPDSSLATAKTYYKGKLHKVGDQFSWHEDYSWYRNEYGAY